MSNGHDSTPVMLRQLPIAARVTIALFMIAVGFGYLAGLVQLHFAHAKSGGAVPTSDDVVDVFHGSTGAPISKMEKLLEAPEAAPFGASGTMRPAFTTKSSGWAKLIKEKKEEEVRKEREGERLVLLDWVRNKAPKEEYESDKRALPEAMKSQPITADYVSEEDGKKFIKIKTLFDDRCTRCHMQNGADSKAEHSLMDTYEGLSKYAFPKTAEGMTLEKRAFFTHAHFLSFAVIFGLTGMIFALTNYPMWLRLLIAPLPLLAQLVEMACWWLAILDPVYARMIVVTGVVVGTSLVVQIMGTLYHLFGWAGRAIVLLLVLATVAGGYQVKTTYVDPYLAAKQQQLQK